MDIQGPVGALQAQFDSATDPQGMVAVLCHPHPQYGGSMHDAVLQTAADVFLANGIDCLRFNFRGVGASDGHLWAFTGMEPTTRVPEGIGSAGAFSFAVPSPNPSDRLTTLEWTMPYAGHASIRIWDGRKGHVCGSDRLKTRCNTSSDQSIDPHKAK